MYVLVLSLGGLFVVLNSSEICQQIVINQFSRVALNERCSFFGNVLLGSDVNLSELREIYDVVSFIRSDGSRCNSYFLICISSINILNSAFMVSWSGCCCIWCRK